MIPVSSLVPIRERQVGIVLKWTNRTEAHVGDATPPAELMLTQTDRKSAEGRRKTYQVQEAAMIQRQHLVRQTSLADIQQQVGGAERGVNFAELHAGANVKQATGEAVATRLPAID